MTEINKLGPAVIGGSYSRGHETLPASLAALLFAADPRRIRCRNYRCWEAATAGIDRATALILIKYGGNIER